MNSKADTSLTLDTHLSDFEVLYGEFYATEDLFITTGSDVAFQSVRNLH